MTYLLGVSFDFRGRKYYRFKEEAKPHDKVVITNEHGTFVGEVSKVRVATEDEEKSKDFYSLFPSAIRKADEQDLRFLNEAEKRGEEISVRAQKESDKLQLERHILRSYLDLYDNKVVITFASDKRVDFRQLVRNLSEVFKMRIEFRQIGYRDEVKLFGALGPCGLPTCCSSFRKGFDTISVNRAKNQFLPVNNRKLSGICGKLRCCLKFEDETYSKLRPLFPKINSKFLYDGKDYKVSGLNVFTGSITAFYEEGEEKKRKVYETFTKEEFERVKRGLPKEDETILLKDVDINSGIDLSGHGIKDTENRINQIRTSEEKRRSQREQISKTQPNNSKRPSVQPTNKGNAYGKKPANGFHAGSKDNRNRNDNASHNPNSFQNRRPNNTTHSFGNNNPRRGNAGHSFSRSSSNHQSGFIPVSQISDKSILDVKPSTKKNNEDQK